VSGNADDLQKKNGRTGTESGSGWRYNKMIKLGLKENDQVAPQSRGAVCRLVVGRVTQLHKGQLIQSALKRQFLKERRDSP
jgi:hypothetical protein